MFFSGTLPYWLKIHSRKTDYCKQHTSTKTFVSGMVDKIMNWEIKHIRKKKSIPNVY
jgi:hypothetical protein